MPALDGVRGLAILMVMALHFIADTTPTNRFEEVVSRVTGYGEYGVDLFFVLSGFLITGILSDARASAHFFENFYIRRALRIFPLYYGVLALVFFAGGFLPFISPDELATLRAHQAWAWLYGVNIYIAKQGAFALPYLDHFWSLAVEEHFYFVWPLVVWLASPRALLRISVAVFFGAFALRVACSVLNVNPIAIYVLTPFRLDALALGGFLSTYSRTPGGLATIVRILRPTAISASILLVALYACGRSTPVGVEVLRPIRSELITLLLAALLLAALTTPATSALGVVFRGRFMRFFGKYSYGLYVFHHFFSYWFVHHQTELVVARWVGSHTLAVVLQAAFGSVASVAVAFASFHLFEKRALRLKRLWSFGPPH
jgi:peptidoglycan/LPS O-acetylase OafA/YrhL